MVLPFVSQWPELIIRDKIVGNKRTGGAQNSMGGLRYNMLPFYDLTQSSAMYQMEGNHA